MSEKPILFSGPMVLAILNEKKIQTRRIVKPQPMLEHGVPSFWHWRDSQWADGGLGIPESAIQDYSPYHVGDRLWVNEMRHAVLYIPKVTLKVTNVQMEQLRGIKPEGKIAEGFCDCFRSYPCDIYEKCPKSCFMRTWDELHEKSGYGWDINPWVWVIEFKRVKPEAEA
jgi:hypothetical protein